MTLLPVPALNSLAVKIYADGADLAGIRALAERPWIRGFTTNPSLMRKAGVSDYQSFALAVLAAVQGRPVSFEVLADDLPGMETQARAIAAWGENVYVKIPVTDTRGTFAGPVLRRLTRAGIKVNVTAVFLPEQVRAVADALAGGTAAVVSVFAGRIADAGIDPELILREAAAILEGSPQIELLWASPREVLNVIQADRVGCRIITLTPDLLAKLALFGKDLAEFSRETVAMFVRDAVAAGYEIPSAPLPLHSRRLPTEAA